MQTIEESDVSRVTLLRKRLGRAAVSMKVIGLLSAVAVAVDVGIVALAPGILVFWFACRLSKRLRLGEPSAARFVALWVVGMGVILVWFQFVVLPEVLQHKNNFYTVLGGAICSLPIYFAIRGLMDLRAYTSGLTRNPSQAEPLMVHPWEEGRNGARKHPRFVNKWRVKAYVFVLLALLPGLYGTAAIIITKISSNADVAGNVA